jgi:hypothetical protein
METGDKNPLDEYDRKNGKPGSVPDAKPISEADAFGTTLNPVRETATPHGPLREV